jgi:hypothetical protein
LKFGDGDMEIDNLLGKYVSVGVPHYQEEGHLFFLFGLLDEITQDHITLVTKKKILYIPIEEVRSVEAAEERP